MHGYRGNQIGWGRLESDSEGFTWQVRGEDSSGKLYAESHETPSHTWDELTSESGVPAEEQRDPDWFDACLGSSLFKKHVQLSSSADRRSSCDLKQR